MACPDCFSSETELSQPRRDYQRYYASLNAKDWQAAARCQTKEKLLKSLIVNAPAKALYCEPYTDPTSLHLTVNNLFSAKVLGKLMEERTNAQESTIWTWSFDAKTR